MPLPGCPSSSPWEPSSASSELVHSTRPLMFPSPPYPPHVPKTRAPPDPPYPTRLPSAPSDPPYPTASAEPLPPSDPPDPPTGRSIPFGPSERHRRPGRRSFARLVRHPDTHPSFAITRRVPPSACCVPRRVDPFRSAPAFRRPFPFADHARACHSARTWPHRTSRFSFRSPYPSIKVHRFSDIRVGAPRFGVLRHLRRPFALRNTLLARSGSRFPRPSVSTHLLRFRRHDSRARTLALRWPHHAFVFRYPPRTLS
jgi:hypothetical protein